MRNCILTFIPNKYSERPTELRDGVLAKYEDAIGEHYFELETAGKLSTLFQYFAILIGIAVLITTKALSGAEVGFTSNKPSYATYQELLKDPKVLNLQCVTTNNSLLYGAFSRISYEQSYACDWVAADLAKIKLKTHYSNAVEDEVIRKSELGKLSACKTKGSEATYVCELVLERCLSGKAKIEAIIKQIYSTPLTLATLASEDFLFTTLATQTNQTVQNMLTGLRDALDTVSRWSSQNMPGLYAFLQAHMNAIQVLRYRGGSDPVFNATVELECARASSGLCTPASELGDGTCHESCNIAECLFDGSDCLNFEQVSEKGPNVKSEWNYDSTEDTYTLTNTYQGYSGISIGNVLNVNPDYDASCTSQTCLNLPFLSWPTNSFQSFDEGKCGNPSNWTRKHVVGRPSSVINDQRAWADYSYYENIFNADNISLPSNRPTGDPPVAITEAFACDRYFNLFSSAGFENVPAAILFAWVEHWKSMTKTIIASCDGKADDWSDGCSNLNQVTTLATESEQQFFLEVEYGAFVTTSNENSGTLLDLGMDASLKRNKTGFAVFPTVSHERYYKHAQVASCSYTKKIKPEPVTLVTVVLGIIGGIVTISGILGSFAYFLAKKRIIRGSKKATMMEMIHGLQ